MEQEIMLSANYTHDPKFVREEIPPIITKYRQFAPLLHCIRCSIVPPPSLMSSASPSACSATSFEALCLNTYRYKPIPLLVSTMAPSLEDVPNELFEQIVELLDLRDIFSLRSGSRLLASKATQKHFKSFFRTKHVRLVSNL